MEWTGQQQIRFLLQSIGLGMVQGLFLDTITGLVPIVKGQHLLWTDVVFGPMAAIATFFGALVIMDGQLHPLMLFGVLLGMAVEHIGIGAFLCKIIRQARRKIEKGMRAVSGFLAEKCTVFGKVCLRGRKVRKKGEKQ